MNKSSNLPIVIACFLVCLIIGFATAWITLGADIKSFFVVVFACIVLAAATRPFVSVWQRNQMFREALTKEAEMIKRKQLNRQIKCRTSHKRQTNELDALDPAMRSIIEKAIKDAKKNGTQVTPPDLMGNIMRNIK